MAHPAQGHLYRATTVEFREDVTDVASKGEAPLVEIAKDFGLSVTLLKGWIAIAELRIPWLAPPLGVDRDAETEEAESVVGVGE